VPPEKSPQDVNVLHEFPPIYNPANLPVRRVLRARILSRFGKTPVLDIRWWDAGEGFTKNGVSIPLESRALLRLESIPMGALAFASKNGLKTDEEEGGFDWTLSVDQK
jgi:hypothetical protein